MEKESIKMRHIVLISLLFLSVLSCSNPENIPHNDGDLDAFDTTEEEEREPNYCPPGEIGCPCKIGTAMPCNEGLWCPSGRFCEVSPSDGDIDFSEEEINEVDDNPIDGDNDLVDNIDNAHCEPGENTPGGASDPAWVLYYESLSTDDIGTAVDCVSIENNSCLQYYEGGNWGRCLLIQPFCAGNIFRICGQILNKWELIIEHGGSISYPLEEESPICREDNTNCTGTELGAFQTFKSGYAHALIVDVKDTFHSPDIADCIGTYLIKDDHVNALNANGKNHDLGMPCSDAVNITSTMSGSTASSQSFENGYTIDWISDSTCDDILVLYGSIADKWKADANNIIGLPVSNIFKFDDYQEAFFEKGRVLAENDIARIIPKEASSYSCPIDSPCGGLGLYCCDDSEPCVDAVMTCNESYLCQLPVEDGDVDFQDEDQEVETE